MKYEFRLTLRPTECLVICLSVLYNIGSCYQQRRRPVGVSVSSLIIAGDDADPWRAAITKNRRSKANSRPLELRRWCAARRAAYIDYANSLLSMSETARQPFTSG